MSTHCNTLPNMTIITPPRSGVPGGNYSGRVVPMQHVRYGISIEDLRQLISYSPDTGELIWLHRPLRFCKSEREQTRWNSRCAGKFVATKDSRGYLRFKLFDVLYKSHRVCWALHYGEWPPVNLHVDHINNIKDDNRIANLQLVTLEENVSLRFSRDYKKTPPRLAGRGS